MAKLIDGATISLTTEDRSSFSEHRKQASSCFDEQETQTSNGPKADLVEKTADLFDWVSIATSKGETKLPSSRVSARELNSDNSSSGDDLSDFSVVSISGKNLNPNAFVPPKNLFNNGITAHQSTITGTSWKWKPLSLPVGTVPSTAYDSSASLKITGTIYLSCSGMNVLTSGATVGIAMATSSGSPTSINDVLVLAGLSFGVFTSSAVQQVVPVDIGNLRFIEAGSTVRTEYGIFVDSLLVAGGSTAMSFLGTCVVENNTVQTGTLAVTVVNSSPLNVLPASGSKMIAVGSADVADLRVLVTTPASQQVTVSGTVPVSGTLDAHVYGYDTTGSGSWEGLTCTSQTGGIHNLNSWVRNSNDPIDVKVVNNLSQQVPVQGGVVPIVVNVGVCGVVAVVTNVATVTEVLSCTTLGGITTPVVVTNTAITPLHVTTDTRVVDVHVDNFPDYPDVQDVRVTNTQADPVNVTANDALIRVNTEQRIVDIGNPLLRVTTQDRITQVDTAGRIVQVTLDDRLSNVTTADRIVRVDTENRVTKVDTEQRIVQVDEADRIVKVDNEQRIVQTDSANRIVLVNTQERIVSTRVTNPQEDPVRVVVLGQPLRVTTDDQSGVFTVTTNDRVVLVNTENRVVRADVHNYVQNEQQDWVAQVQDDGVQDSHNYVLDTNVEPAAWVPLQVEDPGLVRRVEIAQVAPDSFAGMTTPMWALDFPVANVAYRPGGQDAIGMLGAGASKGDGPIMGWSNAELRQHAGLSPFHRVNLSDPSIRNLVMEIALEKVARASETRASCLEIPVDLHLCVQEDIGLMGGGGNSAGDGPPFAEGGGDGSGNLGGLRVENRYALLAIDDEAHEAAVGQIAMQEWSDEAQYVRELANAEAMELLVNKNEQLRRGIEELSDQPGLHSYAKNLIYGEDTMPSRIRSDVREQKRKENPKPELEGSAKVKKEKTASEKETDVKSSIQRYLKQFHTGDDVLGWLTAPDDELKPVSYEWKRTIFMELVKQNQLPDSIQMKISDYLLQAPLRAPRRMWFRLFDMICGEARSPSLSSLKEESTRTLMWEAFSHHVERKADEGNEGKRITNLTNGIPRGGRVPDVNVLNVDGKLAIGVIGAGASNGDGPGNGGWLRDLTQEGVEPNPGMDWDAAPSTMEGINALPTIASFYENVSGPGVGTEFAPMTLAARLSGVSNIGSPEGLEIPRSGVFTCRAVDENNQIVPIVDTFEPGSMLWPLRVTDGQAPAANWIPNPFEPGVVSCVEIDTPWNGEPLIAPTAIYDSILAIMNSAGVWAQSNRTTASGFSQSMMISVINEAKALGAGSLFTMLMKWAGYESILSWNAPYRNLPLGAEFSKADPTIQLVNGVDLNMTPVVCLDNGVAYSVTAPFVGPVDPGWTIAFHSSKDTVPQGQNYAIIPNVVIRAPVSGLSQNLAIFLMVLGILPYPAFTPIVTIPVVGANIPPAPNRFRPYSSLFTITGTGVINLVIPAYPNQTTPSTPAQAATVSSIIPRAGPGGLAGFAPANGPLVINAGAGALATYPILAYIGGFAGNAVAGANTPLVRTWFRDIANLIAPMFGSAKNIDAAWAFTALLSTRFSPMTTTLMVNAGVQRPERLYLLEGANALPNGTLPTVVPANAVPLTRDFLFPAFSFTLWNCIASEAYTSSASLADRTVVANAFVGSRTTLRDAKFYAMGHAGAWQLAYAYHGIGAFLWDNPYVGDFPGMESIVRDYFLGGDERIWAVKPAYSGNVGGLFSALTGWTHILDSTGSSLWDLATYPRGGFLKVLDVSTGAVVPLTACNPGVMLSNATFLTFFRPMMKSLAQYLPPLSKMTALTDPRPTASRMATNPGGSFYSLPESLDSWSVIAPNSVPERSEEEDFNAELGCYALRSFLGNENALGYGILNGMPDPFNTVVPFEELASYSIQGRLPVLGSAVLSRSSTWIPCMVNVPGGVGRRIFSWVTAANAATMTQALSGLVFLTAPALIVRATNYKPSLQLASTLPTKCKLKGLNGQVTPAADDSAAGGTQP